jgi:hypothetical protein
VPAGDRKKLAKFLIGLTERYLSLSHGWSKEEVSGALAVYLWKPMAKKKPLDWQLAPAPESKDHFKLKEQYELFIGGKWVKPKSGKYFDTINPANEQKLARIAEANEADVDAAVKAARKAYEGPWGKMPASERAKYIYRIARLLQEKARHFAVVESMDGGKAIRESRDVDVPLAAAHFFYYAGWADKLGYAFPRKEPRPLGVAGQVIPWNFPLLMASWKLAPALACGNTVVLKPAETTPLTALLLAELIQEAELPEGVVNIVTGAGATGRGVVNHPDVEQSSPSPAAQAWANSSRRSSPDRARSSRSNSAEKQPTSSSPTLHHRSSRGRHHQRHLLQPRPRVLRGQPLVCGRKRARRSGAQTEAPHEEPRRWRSARQEHRHRRDQQQRAARHHQQIPEDRCGADGGEMYQARLRACPAKASGAAPHYSST